MKKLMSTMLCMTFTAAALAAKPPKWVMGADPAYPEATYALGVGVGNDLDAARANARAEISRGFQARVQQTLTDVQTEGSSSLGRRQGPATGTQKSELTTKVATETLLEGVTIPQTWFDKKKGKYYALAALDKRAARQSLSNQITEKEEGIHSRLDQLEDGGTALSKAKALAQALKIARERDALVARRRLVDPAPIADLANGSSTAQIDRQLASVLAKIEFRLDVDGGPKSRAKQAVAGRVSEMGFRVTDDPKAPLCVKGEVAVKPFDRGHPEWKFFHWDGTVQLLEGGKVIASSTPSGEEAALVESTAEAKARDAGDDGLATEAQKLISQYVFGEQ
jgi:hypothetical protein